MRTLWKPPAEFWNSTLHLWTLWPWGHHFTTPSSVLSSVKWVYNTCLIQLWDDKGLTCVIMEAKKSHHLLSVNWTPRKAGRVIQPKFKGLSPRGADSVNPSQRQEMRCPSSSSEAGRGKSLLPLPFVLFRLPVDSCCPPASGSWFTSLEFTDSNLISSETSSQMHLNNV